MTMKDEKKCNKKGKDEVKWIVIVIFMYGLDYNARKI